MAEHQIKKNRENIIAKWIYRPLSEPIAKFLSRFGITPNQVTSFSILSSIISGICFSFGMLEYSILGAVFFQLSVLFDHVDGNLARFTNNLTPFGHWWDGMANKQIKFFCLLGMSYGAYRQTGYDWMLIMGSIAIFNITYSSFIALLKKEVPGAEETTVMPETKTAYFPASLIIYSIITVGGITNQLWFPIVFLSTFGFVWVKQLIDIYNASK